jgi:phenylacetic acid degradation operon negative regulatory protein
VRALVASGELFGLAGNAVRVAVTRLRAEGLVERDQRGSYRLGPRAEAVNQQIRSWRHVEEGRVAWRGGWIGVHGADPAGGPSGRALRFLGFRELRPGLALRPDNLVGGVAAVRSQLHRLGLAPETPVLGIDSLGDPHEQRAHSLWDVAALGRAYGHSLAEVNAHLERLPTLPADRAMAESFLLGGRVIRQIVFDPLLPESIAPDGPRARLVEAMRRYDAAGRGRWAVFLSSFGVPNLRAPADVRVVEAAGLLAAAEGGIR